MKLKNKLIPLAAITATASIVTPLVTLTSCGKTVSAKSYDFVKDGFEYKAPTMPGSELNTTTATTAFYKACAEHSDIFEQEILATLYANYITTLAELKDETNPIFTDVEANEISECKVELTTPVIGKTVVYYPGENPVTYPTVSFKMTLTAKAHIVGDYFKQQDPTNASENVYNDVVYTKTQEFNNVPFTAYIDDFINPITEVRSERWHVGIQGILAKNQSYIFQYMTDKWSINVSKSRSVTTWTDETESSKQTKTETYSQTIDTYAKMNKLASRYADAIRFKTLDKRLETITTVADLIEDIFCYDFYSNYLWLNTAADELSTTEGALSINIGFTTSKTIPVTITGLSFEGTPTQLTDWKLNLKEDLDLSFINLLGDDGKKFEGYKLHIPKDAKLNLRGSWVNKTLWTYADIDDSRVTITVPESGTAIETEDQGTTLTFKMPRTLSVINSTTKNEFDVATESAGTISGTVSYTLTPGDPTYHYNDETDPTKGGVVNVHFTTTASSISSSNFMIGGFGELTDSLTPSNHYYCIPTIAVDGTTMGHTGGYAVTFALYDSSLNPITGLDAATYTFSQLSFITVALSKDGSTTNYGIDLDGKSFTISQ